MKYFAIIFFCACILPPLIYELTLWQRENQTELNDIFALADAAAVRHGLDPRLFRSLIKQESNWQVTAISKKGAIGLGQLMPETAQELGVDPYNPAENLEGSALYFARQLREFGSVELALCAYNAGPQRVRQLGRCPQFDETQRYLRLVLAGW